MPPASAGTLRAAGTGQRGYPMHTQDHASDPFVQPTEQGARRPALDPAASVLVLDGYTAKLSVVDGRLIAEDSSHGGTRTVALPRATCKTMRILILARSGSISISAVQWLQSLGIHLALLEEHGASIQLSMQTLLSKGQDARLRRAQALALDNGKGIEVARYLLGVKLRGQLHNLVCMGYEIPAAQALCDQVGRAPTIEACSAIESRMASIYWDCWAVLDCKWAGRGQATIPQHWRSAGQRLNGKRKQRQAITPINALLNYCYKLAEVETVIALHGIGLDPGFGIIHTDHPYRNSMALDCLEAIRPNVDRFILDLIERRAFTKSDFIELSTGECRISPSLRAELASSMAAWRKAIAPVVEHIANLLRPETRIGIKLVRTPLTNENMRAAQAKMKNRRLADMLANASPADSSELGPLPLSWPAILATIQEAPTALLVHATGLSHRYINRVKRGEKRPRVQHWSAMYRTAQRVMLSNGQAPPRNNADPEPREPASWEELYPLVREAPTARLARATGLTDNYAYEIKSGRRIPHRRHWPTLYQVAREHAGNSAS